ncbi:MAG: aerial mycelium formation protein [Actinomycetota bacterium]|nr:aerial mycelium formation protein [Actinomycetota bacterium]
MSDPKRRLVERIAGESYLAGLNEKSLEDLRAMRDESKEAETELSFERRLAQARIDILSAELDRRSGGGDETLMSRLPQILATEARAPDEQPLPSRAPDFSIPRNADIPRRRIEEIVGEQTLSRLPSLPTDEVKTILASLADHEKTLSARRRKVQEIMDTVQAEIVRRYVSGEADPTAALG